jgi:hypothetical protein
MYSRYGIVRLPLHFVYVFFCESYWKASFLWLFRDAPRRLYNELRVAVPETSSYMVDLYLYVLHSTVYFPFVHNVPFEFQSVLQKSGSMYLLGRNPSSSKITFSSLKDVVFFFVERHGHCASRWMSCMAPNPDSAHSATRVAEQAWRLVLVFDRYLWFIQAHFSCLTAPAADGPRLRYVLG